MRMHDVVLAGCTPEPLMSYLKALGILRLVAEQKDPNAKGCWRDGMFMLQSNLKEQDIVKFFISEYKPTPLVAPWGARSGFFPGSSEKSARDALYVIEVSSNPRLQPFKTLILHTRGILQRFGFKGKPEEEEKLRLMRCCRAQLPDELLDWIDAAFVLTNEDKSFPPLLGTGGNEGSGSYLSGFAQQVVACIEKRKHDTACSSAIFGGAQKEVLSKQTPGHFSTVSAGGANHGQGFEADTSTNPWDYVLCLEGVCLWSSAIVRREDSESRGMAAFPFSTKPSSIGYSGLTLKDGKKPKDAKRQIAEIWLPSWEKPVGLQEVRAIISEGRASRRKGKVETGLDFARAIASLGIDRGIHGYTRCCFLMRNGKSFMAIPLGYFNVRARPDVDLLREIDPWLDKFRRAASDDKAPPRFKSALRRIESAIFSFCQYGGALRFSEILCALGHSEQELANGEKFRKDKFTKPLSGLSPDWLNAAFDNTAEFEIALALSGIWDPERKLGPLRSNLEPAAARTGKSGSTTSKWLEEGNAAVWAGSDLSTNLIAVLERRFLDSSRLGCAKIPLAFRRGASLDAISAFLLGDVDDERIAELIWGLVLVDGWRELPPLPHWRSENALPLPRAFALLKLLYLPNEIETSDNPVLIKPEARVLSLLRAGRTGEACAIAMRRLRSSGLIPMPHSRGVNRDDEWKNALGAIEPKRLAAAMLIPVSRNDTGRMAGLIMRPKMESLEAAN